MNGLLCLIIALALINTHTAFGQDVAFVPPHEGNTSRDLGGRVMAGQKDRPMGWGGLLVGRESDSLGVRPNPPLPDTYRTVIGHKGTLSDFVRDLTHSRTRRRKSLFSLSFRNRLLSSS
jgi:hypothetical protein